MMLGGAPWLLPRPFPLAREWPFDFPFPLPFLGWLLLEDALEERLEDALEDCNDVDLAELRDVDRRTTFDRPAEFSLDLLELDLDTLLPFG